MLLQRKLQVLIIDEDQTSTDQLTAALSRYKKKGYEQLVSCIRSVKTLDIAENVLEEIDINCIFIDPISFGLNEASRFIFNVRQVFPEIVFVLYSCSNEVAKLGEDYYAGERVRFHHYYKLNKRSSGKKLKHKLRQVVYLCISDLRLQVSLAKRKVAVLRKTGIPIPPMEISESLKNFNLLYASQKTAFIIMSFSKSSVHDEISKSIKSHLSELGIIGLRADDHEFHDNLYDNILTYMYGCDFGIAVIERISREEHNPNIAFEIGYMKGLKKSVCILKDQTVKVLQTDLFGKLYRSFDTHSVDETIGVCLKSWMVSKVAKSEVFK